MTPTDPPADADADATAVPDAASPSVCDRCGLAFPDDSLLALHRGRAHAADLTPGERNAYQDAREAETERVRLFRLKVLLALVVVYFGLLFLYVAFA